MSDAVKKTLTTKTFSDFPEMSLELETAIKCHLRARNYNYKPNIVVIWLHRVIYSIFRKTMWKISLKSLKFARILIAFRKNSLKF